MTSTTNPTASFHSYENVVYDEQQQTPTINNNNTKQSHLFDNQKSNNSNYVSGGSTSSYPNSLNTTTTTSSNAINGAATTTTTTTPNVVDSPFLNPDLILGSNSIPLSPCSSSAHILSTSADQHSSTSIGTFRLTSSRTGNSSQELVTKLISPLSITTMDTFKEWSINSFKCAKQILNEKRGIGSITSDIQLQADIDQLRNNQDRLIKFLKIAQQLKNHYMNLVNDQKQLYNLMNELSIKSFQISDHIDSQRNGSGSTKSGSSWSKQKLNGKHIIANFSSLGNNLSSSFTTNSPTHSPSNHHHHQSLSGLTPSSSSIITDFMPVFNHIKSSNVNITDDFKKNAIMLNGSIRNGEKLIMALNFFCSNLATLIYKTMDDTIATIKQLESVRLEYDAERNSLNSLSASIQPSSQTINTAYSSDRLDLAKARYDQLRIDVQIKMRFLEENIIKVVHKQLILFNGAFGAYSSGNTAALDATLKQFSIK